MLHESVRSIGRENQQRRTTGNDVIGAGLSIIFHDEDGGIRPRPAVRDHFHHVGAHLKT
jgi:hypothetical protein